MRASAPLRCLCMLMMLAGMSPAAEAVWPSDGVIDDSRPGVVRVAASASAAQADEAVRAAEARAAQVLAQARRVQVQARSVERAWERAQSGDWGVEVHQVSEVSAVGTVAGLRTVGRRQRVLPDGRHEVQVLVEVDEDEIWPQRALQRAAERSLAVERCQELLALAERRRQAGRHDAAWAAMQEAVRAADEAPAPWPQEARWQRARLLAELGHLAAAVADLEWLQQTGGRDTERAAAVARLQRELLAAVASVRELPEQLASLAASCAQPQRFAVQVERRGQAVEVRWQLVGEPAVLVLLLADEHELMVCEPRGSRPLSGSGSLRFPLFPARAWCWALAPDSHLLGLVRGLRHPRLALGAAAPEAARLEWQGLLTALRAAARDLHPPPAVSWVMPAP